jgi:hypothetical protein
MKKEIGKKNSKKERQNMETADTVVASTIKGKGVLSDMLPDFSR